MATSDTSVYIDAFEDILSRMNPPRSFAGDYFARNRKHLGFDEVETFLSVGPERGEFDKVILPHFPKVKQYIGVEPGRQSRQDLEETLKKCFPNIKYELYGDRAEDWPGPTQPVDLVFASHVLYYFDYPIKVLEKMMTWLRPGGRLVIVQESERSKWCEFINKHQPCHTSHPYYLAEQTAEDLKILKVKIIDEFRSEYTFDITRRTKNLLNFFKMKECNADEEKEVHEYLDTLYKGQTLIPSGYWITVIEKE